MRVLLVTDSLGCPREEIPVDKTWTDRIISEFSEKGIVFYTCCIKGLSAKTIDLEWISALKPDLIITQVGIVDACRHALTKPEYFFFSHIALLSRVVHYFCGKHHFLLTKIRNIHICKKEMFGDVIKTIAELCGGHLYFIKISTPGKRLVNKTFHVIEDVKEYNELIESLPIVCVDPYDSNPDGYLLQDGHHLNNLGNEMVFQCVSKIIEKEMSVQARAKK